jgi:hypothetical protein
VLSLEDALQIARRRASSTALESRAADEVILSAYMMGKLSTARAVEALGVRAGSLPLPWVALNAHRGRA